MERDAKRRRTSAAPDPLDALRALLERGERDLNALLNRVSGTERASAIAGLLQRADLGFRRAARGALGTWFASWNLPTRSDVIRLGKRLAEIEKTLARLEARLDAAGPTPPRERARTAARTPARIGALRDAADARPPRTRKPPLRAAAPSASPPPETAS